MLGPRSSDSNKIIMKVARTISRSSNAQTPQNKRKVDDVKEDTTEEDISDDGDDETSKKVKIFKIEDSE